MDQTAPNISRSMGKKAQLHLSENGSHKAPVSIDRRGEVEGEHIQAHVRNQDASMTSLVDKV